MVESSPLTPEEIMKAYSKVFPTRYEPMTLERMIQFVRIIEQLHGVKDVH
jgi:hypothetical protein